MTCKNPAELSERSGEGITLPPEECDKEAPPLWLLLIFYDLHHHYDQR